MPINAITRTTRQPISAKAESAARRRRKDVTGPRGDLSILIFALVNTRADRQVSCPCGFQSAAWVQTRSEEHTSELQSLMRISYAVFCLKKIIKPTYDNTQNPFRTYSIH